MKIIFVTEYYYPHIGGIETVIQEIAERLVKNGHTVHVVTCKTKICKNQEDLNKVTIHRISVPSWGYDRYWFNSFWAIPTVFKLSRNCDVIHAGCSHSSFPVWFVATILRKKKIVTIHEVWGKEWVSRSNMNFLKAKLHEIIEKVILSLRFDQYICVSKNTLSELRTTNARINISNQTVIYNGIDNILFNPTKADGPRIRKNLHLTGQFVYMAYGRPGISKGIEYLINAVPLVGKSLPNAKLLLILDTNPNLRYKLILKMITDLHIENEVILIKPVLRKELPDYIAAADCIVVPSLSEGFGFSAAEACAMGKPVVASNVGSLPEVISGKHILVEPGNSEAIAEGILGIFNGKAQITPPKTFDWDICYQQYSRIYEKLSRS